MSRGKSGKRIPIGSYSRNSTLFKQCREFVPFEATALLNNITLEQIISSTEEAIIEEQQSISCIGDHIKDIFSYNNSADEKDELILSYKENIKSLKEDIEDYKRAIGVLRTYCDINDAVNYYLPKGNSFSLNTPNGVSINELTPQFLRL